ncbi:short-chain dehydrogenase [Falsochrobactrum shanghaiense]|uniref:Short-chain dehydrogenase n=1 Tax=Falsochrobactrum shanghaiense TaxID=2201899 RepID=A0A316J6L5_9HYPH|nr:NnrS family protein [Falsochrobactrum shanghaiense]PWL17507.1 short-chain dehydrogenase [Falsochrobactrum shanghaiense]
MTTQEGTPAASASPDATPFIRRGAIARGLKTTGPAILGYGFRPFFFGGAIWAILAMLLWILSLTFGLSIGGSYGGVNWHAHEMVFGFAPAVLAGFLLTAVPNWTGRLPVAGTPLAILVGVWLAGRLVFLAPDLMHISISIIVESLFLPLLLFIAAREIVAGKQWRNLKVLSGVALVMIANLVFHYMVLTNGDVALASRFGVSAFVLLVMLMGGRIIPSFTRNWLNRAGETRFPVPFNRYDALSVFIGAIACLGWIAAPESSPTVVFALIAGALHAIRLYRWRGWSTTPEKLVLILHVAYAFVPLGFIAVACSALGWLNPYSALHVMTVGVMGCMMLAVMTRATRGHTGRELTASPTTQLIYLCIVASALTRPFAEMIPDFFHTLLAASALLWMAAFSLYIAEYAPMLLRHRRSRG